MGVFDDLKAKVRAIDTDSMAREVVSLYANEIVERNRESLESGQYDTGVSISPAYTAKTIRIKRKRGQPYDRVTLRNSGRFYSRMRVVLKRTGFSITSTDRKTMMLKMKYDGSMGSIFGLQDADMAWLSWVVAERIRNRIKQSL